MTSITTVTPRPTPPAIETTSTSIRPADEDRPARVLLASRCSVNSPNWFENRRLWLDDLQEVIYRATTLVATDPFTGRSIPQGYFTDSGWSLDDSDEPSHGSTGQSKFQNAYLKSLRLAPSLAANIEAFRDGPIPFTPSPNTPASDGGDILIDQPIHPNQALRPATYDPNTGAFLPDVDLDGDGVVEPMRDDAFIGFEKRPFIMQAFYGLIYPKSSHGQARRLLARGKRHSRDQLSQRTGARLLRQRYRWRHLGDG